MTAKLILTGDVNLMNVTDPRCRFRLVRDEFRAADVVFSESRMLPVRSVRLAIRSTAKGSSPTRQSPARP